MFREAALVIFGALICAGQTKDKSKIVDTKQGRVEGALAVNGFYYEFLGIKYGVPVKFREPTQPTYHLGVFKADNRAVKCPQFETLDPLSSPSFDDEDCLALNIFTPAMIPNNTSLPVMVFLHGGGFGVGSASPAFYGPQYLLTNDVILVTVNYRLNVYGFLNLGIPEAPGNAGLKDIRAALRWINENIANFGGDPDNVTVFGQGTGGIAAIYLTLSESCKGLFHKIITESGSLFSPQAFDSNPLATASKVAKCLEVKSLDRKKLLEVFTETPIAKMEETISKQMNAQFLFVPSVEKAFDDEEPFLTDTPYNILNKGKKHVSFNPVPAILGLNTVEGLTSTLDYHTITSQMDRIKHEDYSALDQRNLIVPDREKEEFRKTIKDIYFSNTTTDEGLIGGIINFNTDFSYVGPMSLFSELYAKNSDQHVYSYIFNYIGNRNLGRILTNTSLEATCNRDELFYLFELERLPLSMDENDARMITFMTLMWTNFATYGSPTPNPRNGEWLPYPHHLAIGLEPEYVAPLTPERAYFWRIMYNKYGSDNEHSEEITAPTT